MTRQRAKGDGSAYQRGRVWWIQYPLRGQQVREPGGLDGRGARTKTEAEEKLRQRLAEIRTDHFIGPQSERITVDSLLDGYIADMETRGKKSVAAVRSRTDKHIRPWFAGRRAVEVTTTLLREFRVEMGGKTDSRNGRKQKLSDASINRCLQTLRSAFYLARKEERLSRIPYFPIAREDNVRKGFFEYAEHEAIKSKLPDPYCDIAEFGYRTGWRRGEIEPLEWRDVDREAGTVFLSDSKSGDPRTFPLRESDGELTQLGDLIERRWGARAYETKDGPAVSEFVFHAGGCRVWDFLKEWHKATEAAGFPHRLFHDYRRTAVRDLIRAGVSQTVAMTITGHKTDAVFRRYNITSDDDKREAISKLKTYRSTKSKTINVVPIKEHSSSTVRARAE
jgi:integrase